ncbi:S8 family peptidase [Mesonia aestuariivivens]|uniref:S8 family serine peptidase n=1 Tax=Mesonia aestuariivivens TaxID=2796128 RepID=A0ABS6W146_9FLAO|nr:S8 family peptidase [Mesonia aestuariivivens]MBW2961578.1 S8 family serine peptidase [Mesonia aestuariivivens]
MKRAFIKPTLAAALAAVFAVSCGTTGPAITSTPIENIDQQPLKNAALTETQLEGWGATDLVTDTIPGMSVKKAYDEIIKDFKGETVIVAVLDSGVDIDHEDLKNIIWTNEDEIPGNGIDDDDNGYIDDVHGWNFLGNTVAENLEYVRILRKLKPKYEGKSASEISAENKEEFALYEKANEEYNKEYSDISRNLNRYKQLIEQINTAKNAIAEKLGKEDFSLEELQAMEAEETTLQQYKALLLNIMSNGGEDLNAVASQIEGAVDYYQGRLDSHLNMQLDGRKTGDDPDDITDTNYGNNQVSGPDPKKEDVKHGTHVAGIIAAERNNGIGMNGVANNVEIMAIRAVPDGDEYDKDIALGIRYAVDNGAKVINTSFGKYYSPHPEWVIDAIKYAAKKDVLIVNAAGNDALDMDATRIYPNDQTPDNDEEIADNFLTVGASNFDYGSDLVARFSNYGQTNVDVFAPGTQIWSTTPNDEYEFLQGTSMASPAVAGVAAMIRSLYPKLSAAEVKQVLMKSGLASPQKVMVGGSSDDIRPFAELSVSGRMVNMYNALIMASKM